ncbi:MAG: DEAD/DEAH box helicase [Planctomycetaceae bacterium]|nr:DEAD/DEAH box helicase [Planctomycetaceae bacterium]
MEELTDQPVPFEDLGLSSRMMRAIARVNFSHASPIQAEFIPLALTGKDGIGQARTGTGKTAAFVIPILEQIDHEANDVQALVLSPTRELSEQVANECRRLSSEFPTEPVLLVGGKPLRPQITALKRGPQIVIGTPGRVIDHLQRGTLQLNTVKIVVLDEADRMLDIGFRPEIEKILRRCPKDRQTLLLSATLPAPVERLAQKYMNEPERVDLSVDEVATDNVEQYYCTVEENRKFGLLIQLLTKERPKQVVVFCRTKRGADQIYSKIQRALPDAAAIHGDLPQSTRDRVMRLLRSGEARLVIATDVVGRGIDVSGISHIVNYDIPEFHDDYVHRVGRTGRLSSDHKGRAFTFVTPEQGGELTRIEMRINKLLKEYRFDNFDAFEEEPTQYVNEDEIRHSYSSNDDDWDSIIDELD